MSRAQNRCRAGALSAAAAADPTVLANRPLFALNPAARLILGHPFPARLELNFREATPTPGNPFALQLVD